jgi:hypothetical protein
VFVRPSGIGRLTKKWISFRYYVLQEQKLSRVILYSYTTLNFDINFVGGGRHLVTF